MSNGVVNSVEDEMLEFLFAEGIGMTRSFVISAHYLRRIQTFPISIVGRILS